MVSPKNTNNSDMGMYSILDSFKLRSDDHEMLDFILYVASNNV